MKKSFFKSFIITIFIAVGLTVYSEANYYLAMKKIDRKIYVAKTQQQMLTKKMNIEKRKLFNGATVRAYKKAIAKIHKKELVYQKEKSKVQKKIYKEEARERKREQRLSSIPGDIFIRVDRYNQTMRIYKGKTLIYSWLCSTGKKGYTTPSGHYKPYYTVKMHYSRKWDMSPMPYSVFYYKGFAIHGTNYTRWLGRRASHGCIRLSTRNAKKVYDLARRYGHKRVHIRVS